MSEILAILHPVCKFGKVNNEEQQFSTFCVKYSKRTVTIN